ncbi:MAG: DUF3644 domain-containing protein [Bacteroidales bacterium]|nr:DUF3644 domain-containing protein [Bacteroidales bacterium]MBN2756826.1 DUF3644 domain-containing protein [Bacteroidales bacterium]
MKARYKHLLENSISAILSAIEIYNKPDFKYRNEIFVILTVNAWELLLKSKILKENNGKINSLYIKTAEGKFATNRNKTFKTIGIFDAIGVNKLDANVRRNIEEFIKIRDNAIHFYNRENLNYLIFTLGVANLKNYQKTVQKWYNRDLLEYNFYILPLGFAYSFKGYSQLELTKEPEIIQDLIKTVQYYQDNKIESEYDFICEIEVNLKAAKKITENTDIEISISKENNNGQAVLFQTKRLIDKYPLTYKQMWEMIKLEIPTIKQSDLNDLIKKHNIKKNDKYSAYHFRSKTVEEDYEKTSKLPKNTSSIYNHDCLKHLKSLLKDK